MTNNNDISLSKDFSAYLKSTTYIDWNCNEITRKASDLFDESRGEDDFVRLCFEFVRDEIKHSWDHQMHPITCKASDVLKFGTGFCYAKSHLLAALLRAQGVPAGLCYQRLTIVPGQPPFSLHGLNAVHLKQYGWYRIDARGNKPGVSASFCPPREQLAFPIEHDGERDFLEIWHEPLPVVVDALLEHDTVDVLVEHLPDIEVV